jgi:hypothetical protein
MSPVSFPVIHKQHGEGFNPLKSSLYSDDKIRLARGMNYISPHRIALTLLFCIGTPLLQPNCCWADQPLPKGVMLNLDFQNIEKGLIPNKTLYPLYVPQNNLGLEQVLTRNVLAFQEGQSLQIPHSMLLEPTQDTWIVTVRFLALSNGIILSQCNDEKGYVLYLKDNEIYAAVRSGYSTLTLKASPDSGNGNCLKRWMTIELRIKRHSAMLSINRIREDLIPLSASFTGKNYKICLGQQPKNPAPFKYMKDPPNTGFTGVISSLKMLRQ